MTVLEAISGRRNIKRFTAQPISPDALQDWLTAASYAPNHRLTEPWEILWIGPETRKRLNHAADFGGAPVVLAILAAPGRNQEETDENIVAAACFAQNLALAAHSAGAGCRWASIGYSAHGREVLEVPADRAVIAVLALGYPEVIPNARPRTPMADHIKTLP
jgi:nitroreductase